MEHLKKFHIHVTEFLFLRISESLHQFFMFLLQEISGPLALACVWLQGLQHFHWRCVRLYHQNAHVASDCMFARWCCFFLLFISGKFSLMNFLINNFRSDISTRSTRSASMSSAFRQRTRISKQWTAVTVKIVVVTKKWMRRSTRRSSHPPPIRRPSEPLEEPVLADLIIKCAIYKWSSSRFDIFKFTNTNHLIHYSSFSLFA